MSTATVGAPGRRIGTVIRGIRAWRPALRDRLKPTRTSALAVITLLGGALRFWGVLHGFRDGYLYHPDALHVIHTAWHHLLGASWLQGRFGVVYGVLMWAALWTAEGVTRLVGYPVVWSFEGIGAVASLLGAMLGTATIPLVYVLGARAYTAQVGVLAAVFLAVSPLHVFQSHYPYRDVPMIFLLVLSLIATVALVQRPSAGRLALASVMALAAAAAKPAGALAFVPLLGACALVVRRTRSALLLVAVGVSALAAAAVLPLVSRRTVAAGMRFLGGLAGSGFLESAHRHLGTLVLWVGVPFLLAAALAVAYAVWRRRPVDLVFVAFLLASAVAIARVRFSDERFHLILLPVACVLVARAVVDGWRSERRRLLLRAGLGLAVAGLVLAAAGRSVFHGLLLALPDTRAIAGGWFEAHVPRASRVALEEYYPLGVNTWPNAHALDTRARLARVLSDADVIVTSSVEHQRYFESPGTYPEQVAFLSALPESTRLVKTVALAPLGFLHPILRVHATRPSGASPPVRLPLPRPYDSRWNRGVALLDNGAYDRDDRTLWLGGAQRQVMVVASPEPVDEMLAIVLNGPAPAALRLGVGWSHREASLQPGEWRTIRFAPRWPLPYRPALYRVEITLRPEGGWALVQLRMGAREIGEALASWGHWAAAIPYLERATRARPSDLATGLLLATAYHRVARDEAARTVRDRLAAQDAPRLAAYRRLTDHGIGAAEWDHAFGVVTGLDPVWLPQALAQEFEAENLVLKAGRHLADANASGDRSVVFDRTRDAPGVLVNGPFVFHQPAGVYRADIRLRAWDRTGPHPIAIVRVYGETRLLAQRAVTGDELPADGGYTEIALPYVHDQPRDRIAFQVEATGNANLAVDRIRTTPDLRASLQRLLAPALIGGP